MNEFENWLKESFQTLKDALKETNEKEMIKDRLYMMNLVLTQLNQFTK